MPNGKIQEEHVQSLKQMVDWLQKNGEIIYGASAWPISPTEEMVNTQKGKKIYVHILDQNNKIFIKDFEGKIKSISMFKGDKPLVYQNNKFGLLVQIPESEINPIDTIVEITLK